jgi:prepilin-type N-terminal cleavage/methylation domain-containing protein
MNKCYNFDMKKSFTPQKGFTLVELLVVIAIIAILTGIVATNFTSARSRARDAKRVSDLGHIQLAIELYFDRCKQYPEPVTALRETDTSLARHFIQVAHAQTGEPSESPSESASESPSSTVLPGGGSGSGDTTVSASANNCNASSAVTLQQYIANIPTPPEGGHYDYVTNGNNTDYVLHVELEGYNEALKDSVDNSDIDTDFPCERGATASLRHYCLGPN